MDEPLRFRHHTVEIDRVNEKVITTMGDGSSAHACPHWTREYFGHAQDKSTGDPWLYCFQHDLVHVLLAELEGRPSPTLWAIAHGLRDDTPEIQDEERRVAEFQKLFFMRSSTGVDLQRTMKSSISMPW